jgi:quercetin dioxygenase-like cupin family protein
VSTVRPIVAVAVALLVLGGCARGVPLKPLLAAPDQLTWVADPRGYQQAVVVGDPAKPGMYAAHIRFPAGLRIAPHVHPDDRIVTVLSGTVHVGYGERFDESRLRALPAGSVWTEPARQPHFAWAKDGDVLLQVIGQGPSATIPIP